MPKENEKSTFSELQSLQQYLLNSFQVEKEKKLVESRNKLLKSKNEALITNTKEYMGKEKLFQGALEAAHDIRSPLVAIEMATEQETRFMREKPRLILTEAVKRSLEIIDEFLYCCKNKI